METNVSLEMRDPGDPDYHPQVDGDETRTAEATEDNVATEAVDSLQLQIKDFGMQVDMAEPDQVVLMDLSLEKTLADLEKEQWYHGCLPYEDIIGLLKSDGDFLVRELEPEGDRPAMACVTGKWEGKVKDYPVHHMVYNKEHFYTIDGTNKCNDVMQLVKLHHSSKIPVANNCTLLHPICKQPWELASEKVTMITKVGAGAYGEVWKGVMRESPNKPAVEVAIKVKRINAENKAVLDEMYKEARLMRQYKHKNVVSFYGIVLKGNDDVMIVMEYVDGGSLKDHLKKTKDIPVKKKVGHAIDVAVGLVYLHSKGCMHRDIACRNCLIDIKKGVVKISDFGLSKQAEVYKVPATEKLAIKWQAPEVILTRTYTVKSDVYSYGILLWEIFNNGESPFREVNNRTVRLKISDPKFRPVVGADTPIVVKRVMKTCWRGNPTKRPTMAQVARYLIHAPSEFLLPKLPALPKPAIPSIPKPPSISSIPKPQIPSTIRKSKEEALSKSRSSMSNVVRSLRMPSTMSKTNVSL
ncbi:Non-specific protein-tyrosine kinase [Trichostrongylus colubriformis]|uniref:Tyrosine-protein kinase n=1 Tax=Trichostrongylus colubriformis TaxID=6319 RepID=A0AAN8J2M4_TRICO